MKKITELITQLKFTPPLRGVRGVFLLLSLIISGCWDEAPDIKQVWHVSPGSHEYKLISKGANPNNWNSLDSDYTRRADITFKEGSDQKALWNIGQWSKTIGLTGSFLTSPHKDSGRLAHRSLDNEEDGDIEIAGYVYPNPFPLVMTSDFYWHVFDTVQINERNNMVVRLNKDLNVWIFKCNEKHDTIPRGKGNDAWARHNLGLYHGGKEPAHKDGYIEIWEY